MDKEPIWTANADLVEAPLAVAKDATGTDDQIVRPHRDDVHFRCEDEDPEWIVFSRNRTGSDPRLS